SYVRRQWLTFSDSLSRTLCVQQRWRSLRWRSSAIGRRLAPDCRDELAVVAIGNVMARQVIPDEACCWFIDVGLAIFDGKFICHCAAKIIGAFATAIADLPSLLVVVAGDGGHGPHMAIA